MAVSAVDLAALAVAVVAAAAPVEITNHGYNTLRCAGLFDLQASVHFVSEALVSLTFQFRFALEIGVSTIHLSGA